MIYWFLPRRTRSSAGLYLAAPVCHRRHREAARRGAARGPVGSEARGEARRDSDIDLLAPLLAGHDVGLLSEAGCPAVADPGANLVRLAHRAGIRVKPLVGPSSILLALMASGLVGQRFSFHGYLPAKPEERSKALKELEKRAGRDDAAQVFIETPYRNGAMLDGILAACQGDTVLSVACDLTLESEFIATKRVAEWPQALPDLHKRPCVFLLWRS